MDEAPSPRNGNRRGGKSKSTSNRPPPSREVQVSKKLSWLLRHGAEGENLALDSGGYANLADVLSNRKLRGLKITFAEVRDIVAENDKQRFGMRLADPEEGDETSADARDWMIRANQGHSVKGVESEGLLERIEVGMEGGLPEVVVHGTTYAAWVGIVADGGLRTMGRNHVHFAQGLPAGFRSLAASEGGGDGAAGGGVDAGQAQAPVISGMRNSSTVLIYLDLRAALEAGLKFWRSANGVVLSEGDAEGKVGMEFFERVEDRTGEGMLVEGGKVVKKAPAGWVGKGKGRR